MVVASRSLRAAAWSESVATAKRPSWQSHRRRTIVQAGSFSFQRCVPHKHFQGHFSDKLKLNSLKQKTILSQFIKKRDSLNEYTHIHNESSYSCVRQAHGYTAHCQHKWHFQQ